MYDNSSFKESLNHQLHIRLHTCMCHKLNAMCHKLCIRLGHQQYSELCKIKNGFLSVSDHANSRDVSFTQNYISTLL